jgi:hypothetical protein
VREPSAAVEHHEFQCDSKPIPGPHLVYGFLTTAPNAVVEPIHPKVMPVRCKGRCRTKCSRLWREALTRRTGGGVMAGSRLGPFWSGTEMPYLEPNRGLNLT